MADSFSTSIDAADTMPHLKGNNKRVAMQILDEVLVEGQEVRWDDIAGLEFAKTALKEAAVYPSLRPGLFTGLREPVRGILLFGPPGTGKSMLAKAVATETGSTFFSVSAGSLTSRQMGESTNLVRSLFSLAKTFAPTIIFVDEIDTLLSSQSGYGESETMRSVKKEFLIQWDNLQRAAAGEEQTDKGRENGTVLVLAATNLPWDIDEAARSRLVRRLYIPLPKPGPRLVLLKNLLSHQKHCLDGRGFKRLVNYTEGFSGSDITALAKDAAMGPLRSLGVAMLLKPMDEIRPIEFEDFEASFVNIRRSVSKEGLSRYVDWAEKFGQRGE